MFPELDVSLDDVVAIWIARFWDVLKESRSVKRRLMLVDIGLHIRS